MLMVKREDLAASVLCAFIVLLLFLTGCKKEAPLIEERIYPVVIADTKTADIPIYIESIGNIYSMQVVQVRPQVGGVILEAFVNEGDYVSHGDPLYQIDPRPYKDALDVAKATVVKDSAALQFAKIKVERYSELVKQDYFSKLNFEQFTTEVSAAKGQVLVDEANQALAELNLEWTTVTSPIDGKIGLFTLDPGNLVKADDLTAIAEIRQISPIDVRFNVTQKDFVEVQRAFKAGTLKCEVRLPQEPQKMRPAEVYFIDNHLDLSTGTILLKSWMDNKDEQFWPGEFVKVRLQLKIYPQAVLIPEEAVQLGQEGFFVYVFNQEASRVEYRLVDKGETVDRFVLIKNGIGSSDKIVVQGQLNLRPGSKVRVVEPLSDLKNKSLQFEGGRGT